MSQRLNYAELSAPMFEKMSELSMATKQHSALNQELLHLVDILVSTLNKCAFCVDMHVKEAKIHGVRELKVYHLAVWQESPLFSDKERAAFKWAELVTKLGPDGVHDADFQAARAHLSEQELSDLNFAVLAINGWNRLAVPFAMVPGSADQYFGLDKAGL